MLVGWGGERGGGGRPRPASEGDARVGRERVEGRPGRGQGLGRGNMQAPTNIIIGIL